MKEIGGYFELELKKGASCYHDTPYLMKSGRSALHYILDIVKPKMVYIPYFSCRVLLEPFAATGIPYTFYKINERLEPTTEIELGKGEYFLYINYFDLKRETVATYSEKYKDKLIVDCTQAFFMKGNNISWFFNSCRKFFGVPDGAYIYSPADIHLPMVEQRNEAYICDHLIKRFNGHATDGYDSFRENEILAGRGVAAMSRLSEYLLSAVNYQEILQTRCTNYDFLHSQLKVHNLLEVPKRDNGVPIFYPFVTDDEQMRSKMISNKIYIGIIWPDIDSSLSPDAFEHYLSRHLLPLPIDQRYTNDDMKRVVDLIMSLSKK